MCQMVRDARRQRNSAADVLLTMRELEMPLWNLTETQDISKTKSGRAEGGGQETSGP